MSYPQFLQYGDTVSMVAPSDGYLGLPDSVACLTPLVDNVGFKDNISDKSLRFRITHASKSSDTSIVANGDVIHLQALNASTICPGKFSGTQYLSVAASGQSGAGFAVQLSSTPHDWTVETSSGKSVLVQYGESVKLYDKSSGTPRVLCKSRGRSYGVSGSSDQTLQCSDVQTAFVQFRDKALALPTVAQCPSCTGKPSKAPTSACVCANPAQPGSFLPPKRVTGSSGTLTCSCVAPTSLTPAPAPSPGDHWLGLSLFEWGIIGGALLLILGLVALFV